MSIKFPCEPKAPLFFGEYREPCTFVSEVGPSDPAMANIKFMDGTTRAVSCLNLHHTESGAKDLADFKLDAQTMETIEKFAKSEGSIRNFWSENGVFVVEFYSGKTLRRRDYTTGGPTAKAKTSL